VCCTGGLVLAITFFEKELKSTWSIRNYKNKVLEKEVPQNPAGGTG